MTLVRRGELRAQLSMPRCFAAVAFAPHPFATAPTFATRETMVPKLRGGLCPPRRTTS